MIGEYSTKEPPPNPTTSYTATDQLGSPRVITDSQGNVVSRRDFMPFGEELTPDGVNRTAALKYNLGDGIRQKFTGYQKDEETNLDFAEARMYENRHARFTAVDPLLASGKSANPQTFNRYVYVVNNPLIFTDPDGLQIATATGKVYYNKRTSEVGIFEGRVRRGFKPLDRNINTTTTINGAKYRMNVTPTGWTIGNRVGNTPVPAAKKEPVPATSTGNEIVRDLANAVSNNPALKAVDRITNPDGITAGFQVPVAGVGFQITVTRNFDFIGSYTQSFSLDNYPTKFGRQLEFITGLNPLNPNPGEWSQNLKTFVGEWRNNWRGGFSVQGTIINESRDSLDRGSRLEFFGGTSVTGGGCAFFLCGGETAIPQDPQRGIRSGTNFGWTPSPAPSANLTISTEAFRANPNKFFFGDTYQNSN